MASKEKGFTDVSSSESYTSGSETEESDGHALPRVQPAAIARKRSMSRSGKPAGKKTRVAAGPSTKTKRVNSAARGNEFPNESLTVSLGKIYCNACHLVLSSKKSIIKNHVTTVRHKKAKENLEKACVRQQTLSENWATYQKTNAPDCAGAGLLTTPNDVAKRRVDVVEAFLTAGVPFAKVIDLRPLLEAGNLRLTDRAHLAQYIPFLTDVEIRLKEEFTRRQG